MRTTGLPIDRKEAAQLTHQHIGRRQRISGGASRASGRALAAASTNVGIDDDVIASRLDCPGRAEIQAAAAANNARTRMRTQAFVEGDVARLVEGTDEIACSDDTA